MVDISMCSNHACPSREKCFRYMAKPNELYQAYATFYPPKGRRKCDNYLPVRRTK